VVAAASEGSLRDVSYRVLAVQADTGSSGGCATRLWSGVRPIAIT
jgi:hypothetical protein